MTTGRVRMIERQTSGDALLEGETLLPIVRGLAAPERVAWVAVVVRAQRIELIDPRPFAKAGPDVMRFMAGLTRSHPANAGPALAVGIAGTLQLNLQTRNTKSRATPIALAFLEAPDCDWWMWQRFLGMDEEEESEAPEQILTARRGDALPNGLGRWWSLGRRARLKVQFEPQTPTSEMIH
ncbi:MAG: hypothetical protein AAGA48_13890 [Myxococcota bacterium]